MNNKKVITIDKLIKDKFSVSIFFLGCLGIAYCIFGFINFIINNINNITFSFIIELLFILGFAVIPLFLIFNFILKVIIQEYNDIKNERLIIYIDKATSKEVDGKTYSLKLNNYKLPLDVEKKEYDNFKNGQQVIIIFNTNNDYLFKYIGDEYIVDNNLRNYITYDINRVKDCEYEENLKDYNNEKELKKKKKSNKKTTKKTKSTQ